jgi:hypothetical protein
MSIDFNSLLTVEEKQNIVVNKIKNYAAEAYQVSLNKEALEKNPEANADGIVESDKALLNLEEAINVYKNELESLTSAN